MAASTKCNTLHVSSRDATGYLPIENYGMIGNMRTCALVSMDGSIDFLCWPDFDSPSVFCRLLDKDKGGYFSIAPPGEISCTTKQQYLPSSAILQTRYIHEDGVVDLSDFFPRPKTTTILTQTSKHNPYRESRRVSETLKKWLVRTIPNRISTNVTFEQRVECIRGQLAIDVHLFPAFDYAREPHTTTILQPIRKAEDPMSKTVSFRSSKEKLQLDVTVDRGHDSDSPQTCPTVIFKKERIDGMLSEGVTANIFLTEGQAVSFVLRDEIDDHLTDNITTPIIDIQQNETQQFWFNWLSKSTYKGRWREVVTRSLMLLKLLTYEPTGAIVAAPTFSIPEAVGGVRNWDYRFSWVRDSSFTIYILLRLGFIDEADAYMEFINERLRTSLTKDGDLPIMFTIRGETEIPELELSHFDGYKGSKPVRIGNEAAYHQQYDIYGELMDGIYLYQKYGKPISWDTWVSVRKMLNHLLTIMHNPDMSIWEVRNNKQHFVYSKIMMWVAFDRGLRLADKRCLPCPNRQKWLEARDSLCEEIMEKGYNEEMGCFIQSYENKTMLDSSILIAPLVFFIAPNDPRFLRTMDRILQPHEKGGLTSTGLVSRYDTTLSEDGVGGNEGAFSMCTFWLVEAMTRAGIHEPQYIKRAVNLFENMLSFSNHLSMFSEEIARSGEQLGNTPQAFSHLALISAAFNLDRAAEFKR